MSTQPFGDRYRVSSNRFRPRTGAWASVRSEYQPLVFWERCADWQNKTTTNAHPPPLPHSSDCVGCHAAPHFSGRLPRYRLWGKLSIDRDRNYVFWGGREGFSNMPQVLLAN